jgi:hypothetical protein
LARWQLVNSSEIGLRRSLTTWRKTKKLLITCQGENSHHLLNHGLVAKMQVKQKNGPDRTDSHLGNLVVKACPRHVSGEIHPVEEGLHVAMGRVQGGEHMFYLFQGSQYWIMNILMGTKKCER